MLAVGVPASPATLAENPVTSTRTLSEMSGSAPLAGAVPAGVLASPVVMPSWPVIAPSKPPGTSADSASIAACRSAKSLQPDSV